MASDASEVASVNREGQKWRSWSKRDRRPPTPIISFVAGSAITRAVGDQHHGRRAVEFQGVLGYWEARFATIRAGRSQPGSDRREAILKPNSENSRQSMDEAFEQTDEIREEVTNVLLPLI